MNHEEERITANLFRTEALKIAPADKPFWYTSGTLGPYFINTHYLFGGPAKAGELLQLIDRSLDDRLALPAKVGSACVALYEEDSEFRALIDYAISLLDFEIDAISGGERRDFYFSYVIAEKLGLPHVTLFKNNQAILTDVGLKNPRELHEGDLADRKVVHVADLITEASSYTRNWLPTLRTLGAEINRTLAVVDRRQGGREVLAEEGVDLIALVELTEDFFAFAVEDGQITEEQKKGILRFQEDTHGFMQAFLETHPDFIGAELAAGGKSAERAERAIQAGFAERP